MSVVALDTLKLARSLREKAKLSPDQAEGFADAIAEALQGDLATKADVNEAKLELKAEIERTKSELVKWTLGAIGFQTVAIFGAVLTLARAFRP